CVRAPEQPEAFLNDFPTDRILSLGVVDGRNIWKTDLNAAFSRLEPIRERLGNRLWLAPGCSLLHSPVDLALETKLDTQLKSWLAFGVQRLQELAWLKQGLNEGKS